MIIGRKKRPDLSFELGQFGENLAVTGPLETEAYIGGRFKIGTVVLEITQPRMPCFKLGIKMNDPHFIKAFLEANYTGYYFKVIEEGILEVGDTLEKVQEATYKLSIDEVGRAFAIDRENPELLMKIMESPYLIESWKDFYQKRLEAVKRNR